jgi:hypothetical protein
VINDLNQYFGGDVALSPTGDLGLSNGALRGQQRILRRLLTNPAVQNPDGTTTPGDYLWHPTYGAGLPSWIGRLQDIPKITALIRGQILLEDSVAKNPEPQITVSQIAGGLTCSIKYVDAQAGTPQTLSFNVKV